jgi:hypothetical protein
MKDKRYNTVGKLIRSNEITKFEEIMDTIPKTRLAIDLGINPARFNRLINNVHLFPLQYIYDIAKLLDVDFMRVVLLIHTQITGEEKPKRKK